jgi:hypothetical protein
MSFDEWSLRFVEAKVVLLLPNQALNLIHVRGTILELVILGFALEDIKKSMRVL